MADEHTALTINHSQLQKLLEEAAEKGASNALKSIGLSDENAFTDIRELRSLMTSWREVRKSALQATVKLLTTALLGALLLGLGIKIGAANLLN